MHKHLYVMLMKDKNKLDAGVVERHVKHLRMLDESGRLVLCGPFADYDGGMVVFEAAAFEEADETAKSDPFILEGYKTYELRTLERADSANNYLMD